MAAALVGDGTKVLELESEDCIGTIFEDSTVAVLIDDRTTLTGVLELESDDDGTGAISVDCGYATLVG